MHHAWRIVVREPGRTLSSMLGVGIAAALLSSVVLFGTASGTTATRRALAELPVDGQAVIAPGADADRLSAQLAGDPAVTTVLPFDLVHVDAASLTKHGAATQTSIGVIVGIGPDYRAATGLFAVSQGTAIDGEVAVSRDLATNLGATPGDTVSFRLPGGASVDLRISGIVETNGADLLLGPIDAAHRAAGANPPTNVAVTDLATLRAIESRIPGGAVAADPVTGISAPGGGPAILTAPEAAVLREAHLRYDHALLPGDPNAAMTWLDSVRRRIERDTAGSVTVADDASATLEPVAADLVWGQILFLFLALPGVILALTLSRLAADSERDGNRRHAALLRARGASPQQLTAILMGATAITAGIGAVVGTGLGIALGLAVFGETLRSAASLATVGAMFLCALAVTALATMTAAWPIRAQLRTELTGERQELQRQRRPRWQRAHLDLLALVVAAAVYLLVGGSGVHPVLGVEGNPTVSLALASFVAPLLLWVGGTLVLIRVFSAAIRRADRLRWLLRGPLGAGGELAASTLSARSGAASRVIVVLALAVSFATSVLIFDATYRQQQHVDAALTLGADLRATPATTADRSAVETLQTAGLTTVTPFSDRVVYVGSEAQDLLAIDPATLPGAAPLADSFFRDLRADDAMAALRARSDAILVSAETATDYSLVVGDRLRIRIPDSHGQLREVDFQMAGVATEFPTAPRDAFLVANLDYVVASTGDPRITAILARQTGDTTPATLAATLGPGWAVTDVATTLGRLANSVTSVDLSALVAIDVAFAVLIASVGVALFLLAGLSERRRELATLTAIGAEPRQVQATIAAETGVVAAAGLVGGLTVGVLIGQTLLVLLAAIFDPPATLPVVPMVSIGAVAVAVVAGLTAAAIVAGRAAAHIDVLAALRER